MAVSIASPLTPHLVHVVTIGIFVLCDLPVAMEPLAPCVCQSVAIVPIR